MIHDVLDRENIVQRVRAILLTDRGHLLFIKRVKPTAPPYWVAPGGGVEDYDESLYQTLARELLEELGATADVIFPAFVLRHHKKGRNLEEFFFVCRLQTLNLSLRHGPEFSDPSRGLYLPDTVALEANAIRRLNIKTPELADWLLDNLDMLRATVG